MQGVKQFFRSPLARRPALMSVKPSTSLEGVRALVARASSILVVQSRGTCESVHYYFGPVFLTLGESGALRSPGH